MLVLLSSGARRRYREDIVRALALPSGLDLQFRYDAPYVEAGLADRARSGALNGSSGIVVFTSTSKVARTVSFVSCRLVTITEARQIGSSVVVNFRVQGQVHTGNADPVSSNTSTHTKGPQWQLQQNGEPKLVGAFFFDAPDLNVQPAHDATSAFEATVKRLTSFADFHGDAGQEFYSILGVSRISVDAEGSESTVAVSVGSGGGYRLETGETYELKIYTYAPDQSPVAAGNELRLHIDSDTKNIEFPTSKFRTLDSRYDLKSFRFVTPESVDALRGSIRVYVKGSAEKAHERADVLLPVFFAGAWCQGLGRALFLASGTAIAAIAAAWDKLGWGNGLLIVVAALAAGFGSVFFSIKKN